MIVSAPDVLRWLRAVQARAELTHAERCVAFALALRVNGQTGRCNPSRATLGADSGSSEATAKRAVSKLRELGLLNVDQSPGRMSNGYALTMPSTAIPETDTTGSQAIRLKASQPGHGRTGSPANRFASEPQPGHQRSRNRVTGDPQTDEGTDEEQREARAPASRGSRLPLCALPPDWETWTREHRPDLDPGATWEAFRDYWTAKPGKDGRKTDWLATWRNWCRKERAPGPGAYRNAPAAPEPTGAAYRPLRFDD